MKLTERLAEAGHSARVLARAGLLMPERPGRLLHMAGAVRHWGATLGAAFAAGAARYGDRAAVVDERGTVSYAALDARSDALARALTEQGIRSADVVAVLCRNHRYFLEVTGALAKLGADALYLNTGFMAPQVADVVRREGATVLVHDDEFTELADEAGIVSRIVAWADGPSPSTNTIDDLARRHATGPRPARPSRNARTIILTSGTTGTPKGAAREHHASAATGISLLESIPYKSRETMVVAAPTFHSWGFGNTVAGLLLGATLVLDRKFDPERVLASIARDRAEVLVAVPVMLARLLEVPADVRRGYDTSSLRIVPLSGSALPGDLATRFMDAFGDVIYNLYGSTEVGYVSVATPEDLRAAPSSAGRPPRGTTIRLLDDEGHDVPGGQSGCIHVRSGLVFDGYTDGASKKIIDGFTKTGDTGHFDTNGRLFIDGRDDDMIISGGENVFPEEVEDVIATLPEVFEVAVIGVPDDTFSQRLKAFVVRQPGATLDADAVRAHVRDSLARFKIPRDVEFIDELPRNATGKVLKRDLA